MSSNEQKVIHLNLKTSTLKIRILFIQKHHETS